MKKQSTGRILNLTAILVFLFCMGACEGLETDGSGKTTPYDGIVLTKGEEAVRDVTNDFSLKLFGQLVSGNENVFISPMAVTMLNLMLANGAEGETYDEIVKTMGLGSYSIKDVNAYYKLMTKALMKADKSVSLSLSNSMWLGKDFSVKIPFKNSMDKVFDADIYNVDFSKESSVKKINQWANSKTSGLIPQLLERVDGNTSMMLVNALYFHGEWYSKFKEIHSKMDKFHCLNGSTSYVTYMSQLAPLSSYIDDEVLVVRMPYGNQAFQMEAILPLTDDFLGFVSSLTMDKLVKWDQDNTDHIELHFPRMDLEYDSQNRLPAALKALGMKQPFSATANFSAISNCGVYVSDFLQKAKIKVDEEGTTAAAAGLFKLRTASDYKIVEYPKVYFDRPFVFLIRESSTGCILFMGTKVK